jgi:cob(I)alamin adenosyltransferase
MHSIKNKHGLLMINTGDGKGKTTAALGLLLRAWGWDLGVVMFQFIKDTRLATGEHRAARKLGLDIRPLGTGFTWKTKDKAKAENMALEQWIRCQEAILSGQFDMIIMDEVSYALNNAWIPLSEVVDTIQRRPPELHLLLTGRDMPAHLREMADLVTEMKEVKHHYQRGIKAQKGIEY